jgi:hypothetical protein
MLWEAASGEEVVDERAQVLGTRVGGHLRVVLVRPEKKPDLPNPKGVGDKEVGRSGVDVADVPI